MSGPVDVLAVLQAYRELRIKTQSAAMSEHDGSLLSIDDAIAAVAELIDADCEFDAAHLAYSAAKTGKPRNDAWARVFAAIDRRHAAMKQAVGGAA